MYEKTYDTKLIYFKNIWNMWLTPLKHIFTHDKPEDNMYYNPGGFKYQTDFRCFSLNWCKQHSLEPHYIQFVQSHNFFVYLKKSYHVIQTNTNQTDVSIRKHVQFNKDWDKLSIWLFTLQWFIIEKSSINKLQIQSDIHASLSAGDELVVLCGQMSSTGCQCLPLDGIHPTWEWGGEAKAHSPLGVRLRPSHLILNIKVPKHLLLLLESLHAFIV